MTTEEASSAKAALQSEEPVAPRRLPTVPWAALSVRYRQNIEARSSLDWAGALDSPPGEFEKLGLDTAEGLW